MIDLPLSGDAMAGTPGAVLAAAREAAGLTQTDVAGQMRISLRQLEAIEGDRYDELPGAVFVRGFVRNYARLLSLDPLPLLHALEPALGSETPLRAQHFAGALPVHSRRGYTRVWVSLFVVLVVGVLGAAVYEYWRSRTTGAGASSVPEVPLAKPDPPSVPVAGTASVPVTTSEPVLLTPELVSQSSIDAAASAAPNAGASAEQSANAARGGRLELTFVAESWVEVRDKDGNVIHSGTGIANTSRIVEGTPPLSISIGNASGVRITYNRKPVDIAANASRNIARLTLE